MHLIQLSYAVNVQHTALHNYLIHRSVTSQIHEKQEETSEGKAVRLRTLT